MSHSWNDVEMWLDQTNRTLQFYENITEHHQGFLMNSHWIEGYEALGRMMSGMTIIDDIPFEIHPFGNRVDITLNYLELNPIQTVSGEPVEELVIWDQSVLNILVPVALSVYEDEIVRGYLEHFYNQNALFRDLGYSRQMISALLPEGEGLTLNVIYVESEQYYFTFDPHVRPETGNRVKDPIAVIFTGSYHDSKMMSTISMGLYFVTDDLQPFSVIAPILTEYELNYHIRFVYSTFEHNGEVIANVAGDLTRILLLMGGLLLTNVIVSYNLIANYFWRHKHVLFTKKLFGYNLFKRHQWFILSFLGYLIPLIVVVSLLYGLNVLLIGILTLVAELITMLIFEHRLMKKSIAEIMKGER